VSSFSIRGTLFMRYDIRTGKPTIIKTVAR
jgi:hypothetical protein